MRPRSDPGSWPQSPAHPTLSHSYCPRPSSPSGPERDAHAPLPPVPAPAPGPQMSRERRAPSRPKPRGPRRPERARRRHARHARPAGPASAAAGLPAPGRAVSRELGVNSPEWRPKVCSPRRRRYPGPTGPELEAAAGTSGGRIPGAASRPPPRVTCVRRARGPEGGGLACGGRALPATLDPQDAVPAATGACGDARHSDAAADATCVAVGSERAQGCGLGSLSGPFCVWTRCGRLAQLHFLYVK